MSVDLTGLCLYMPQVGFEPGTYGILSTWISDIALDHSATTAEYVFFLFIFYHARIMCNNILMLTNFSLSAKYQRKKKVLVLIWGLSDKEVNEFPCFVPSSQRLLL